MINPTRPTDRVRRHAQPPALHRWPSRIPRGTRGLRLCPRQPARGNLPPPSPFATGFAPPYPLFTCCS
eukprot:1735064-Pleurochrysis_carterae.AAC.1